MADFFFSCGHFFSAAPVNDGYAFRSHSHCASRGVHSYVACAHNYHVFTSLYGRYAIFLVCAHKVYTRQIFVCRQHAVETFAGNIHKHRKSRSAANKHGVVRRAKLVDKYRFTHYLVGFYVCSESYNIVDFLSYQLFGKAELGYSVHEYAARAVQRFVNIDVETGIKQRCSTRKTRRAAAHYRRSFADFFGFFGSFGIIQIVIAHKAFHRADRYCAAFDCAYAFTFALNFLRAYSAAYRRQKVGGFYYFCRTGKIAFFYRRHHFGNMNRNRATLHTRSIFAAQASKGFCHCRLLVEAGGYFKKIFSSVCRTAFGNIVSFVHFLISPVIRQ